MERTMPTYEYQCDGCGHQFDQLQSFKDDALKTCPKCKEERLRRLFGTGAAILFKGSGFYETDYRSESYKKAAKADQEAGKPAETKSTDSAAPAKTETTKSETKASSANT